MVFPSNTNIGEVEMCVKQKAGMGNDISFYAFGNRKNLKGELVFE
jgi:hypothetical protein